MPDPQRQVFTNADGRRLRYYQWGGGDRVCLCVHGLLRTGKDFHALADALHPEYTLIAPDMAGRGESEWAVNPGAEYEFNIYMRDLQDLVAHLQLSQLDYVGTSMGGVVGMLWAGAADTPIRRLVLNDIGPTIPIKAMSEIADQSRRAPKSWRSFEEGAAFIRDNYLGFGPLNEAQWARLARDSLVERDGQWHIHYDPRIVEIYKAPPIEEIDLWPDFSRFQGSTMVLHGVDSFILLPPTVERLRASPNVTVLDVADTGHAPALVDSDQLSRIRAFLLEG